MSAADNNQAETLLKYALTIVPIAGFVSLQQIQCSTLRVPDSTHLPEWCRSLLILAVPHLPSSPKDDWWSNSTTGGTVGNHNLIKASGQIKRWAVETLKIRGT